MSIPKTLLKNDVLNLISDWGETVRVSRFSGALNLAGKMSGAFVSVSTQILWIQPYDRRRTRGSIRDQFGLVDETTHECFWAFAGYNLLPNDRLTVSGVAYSYDVLSTDQPENYRHAWLKLTQRS